VLRFPLVPAEIGASSVGDRLSGIWAHVVPLSAPPSGFTHGTVATPRAKWFAIGSFGEKRDSLVYGVVLDSMATTMRLMVDRRGQFALDDREVVTLPRPGADGAPAVSARVLVGKGAARRGVRFSVDARGRLQWRPDDRWDALLWQGNGALSVRIIPFEPGSWITFVDHDNDGMHDQSISRNQVLALGGYFWAWALEAATREMVLTRSVREPVIAGYRAPDATARRDTVGPVTPLIAAGMPTLLVFCYVGCEGCKLAMPAIDTLLGRAGTGHNRRVVIVAKNPSDGRTYESTFGTRMQVVLGEEAWERFAVMPTPTFVEIDQSGMIVWRDEGWSAVARRRIEAFLDATQR
jgi:hypothetical protein